MGKLVQVIDIGNFFLGFTFALLFIASCVVLYSKKHKNDPVNKAEDCIAKFRSTNNVEYLADARIQLEVAILREKRRG